ncbi:unnamed protein product, partial [Rhizoctonia solani]
RCRRSHNRTTRSVRLVRLTRPHPHHPTGSPPDDPTHLPRTRQESSTRRNYRLGLVGAPTSAGPLSAVGYPRTGGDEMADSHGECPKRSREAQVIELTAFERTDATQRTRSNQDARPNVPRCTRDLRTAHSISTIRGTDRMNLAKPKGQSALRDLSWPSNNTRHAEIAALRHSADPPLVEFARTIELMLRRGAPVETRLG